MEIMNRVADHIKRKSWTYYISMCILFFITICIIFGYMKMIVFPSSNRIQITNSKIVKWIPYFLLSSFEFAIICIWRYYAPIVIRGLESLRSAFLGTTEYESLYNSYKRWMKQFDLHHPGKSKWFKVCYIFFWLLFLICALILSCDMFGIKGNSYNRLLIRLHMVLVSSTIILNFSSYYICIIFVYFLIRVYYLGQEGKLKYEKTSLPLHLDSSY